MRKWCSVKDGDSLGLGLISEEMGFISEAESAYFRGHGDDWNNGYDGGDNAGDVDNGYDGDFRGHGAYL